ncbi:MAG: phosphoglucomutase/phosphomannomutase family protein, partial [Chloroflexota bacterium]
TRMIDRLANNYGLTLHETPVGFNYIAELMLKEDVLIGGEESGGISIKGHIPEGDGVLMGLLLLEIVASNGKSLYELVKDLLKEVGPAHYSRTDLRLKRPLNKKEFSERLVQDAPKKIGGQKMAKVESTDGTKYILKDDSWLLIRASGTEPVLRVYAEGRSPEMVEALLAYGEEVANGAA